MLRDDYNFNVYFTAKLDFATSCDILKPKHFAQKIKNNLKV